MSGIFLIIAAALAITNDWENPAVNSISRLPARTYSVPLSSLEEALSSDPWSVHASEMSLDGIWSFRWAGNPSLVEEGFQDVSFDDSKWDEIDVPSCVEMRGWGVPHYSNIKYPHLDTSQPSHALFARILDRYSERGDFNPVSCYRRSFRLPDAWRAGRTILRFEGVGSAFYVWVNGKMAGYAEDSKLPSEFDITPFVKRGEKNLIAVKVYKWCDGSFFEDQDMFRFSGIFRNVSIWNCPDNGIWDFTVRTSLSKDCSEGHVSVGGVEGQWKWSLYDNAGRKVASFDSAVDSNGAAKTVKNVKAWSAEKPFLYTLVIEKGGDIRSKKIGFKTQAIIGSVFYVNSKPVKLHGVNRHETSPENGRTLSLDEMLRDIVLMKRHNIDTVRTSHYPNHRLWYDLCDLYGIYVVAEANAEAHEPGYGRKSLGRIAQWRHTIVERNERNVLTYRNSPCVIMWSLGNEVGHGDSFKEAYKAVKAADPLERPVHWERGSQDADVHSTMYPSIEFIRKRISLFKKPSARSSAPLNPPPERPLHDKPYFICEYAISMGNSTGNLEEYWNEIYSHPGMMGGCIWEWIDHAVWARNNDSHNRYLAYGGDYDDTPNDGPFCCNGILNPDRKVNAKLIEVAHVYRPFDISRDAEGRFVVENRLAFTSPGEFRGKWTCFVDGSRFKEGVFELPQAEALGTAFLDFDFSKSVALGKAALDASEVVLRFDILARNSSLHAPEGFKVATCEIPMSGPVAKTFPRSGDAVKLGGDGKTLVAECASTKAVFNRATGTLSSLVMNGVPVMSDPAPGIPAGPRFTFSRAFVDNDHPLRIKFRDSGLTQLKYTPAGFEVASNSVRILTRITGGKSAGFMHEAVWKFFRDGSIVVENAVEPFGSVPQLPRAGLSMRLSPKLENMRYYGRGPWENYIDRCRGSMLGIWKSTVTEQYVEYVRPQDNGYKTSVRWAEFLDETGAGVRFEADVPLFMQALHCSEDSLEWARHRNGETRRLKPVVFHDDIFLKLDVRQRGLGGEACGPGPRPEYNFDQNEKLKWNLRISPVIPSSSGEQSKNKQERGAK